MAPAEERQHTSQQRAQGVGGDQDRDRRRHQPSAALHAADEQARQNLEARTQCIGLLSNQPIGQDAPQYCRQHSGRDPIHVFDDRLCIEQRQEWHTKQGEQKCGQQRRAYTDDQRQARQSQRVAVIARQHDCRGVAESRPHRQYADD